MRWEEDYVWSRGSPVCRVCIARAQLMSGLISLADGRKAQPTLYLYLLYTPYKCCVCDVQQTQDLTIGPIVAILSVLTVMPVLAILVCRGDLLLLFSTALLLLFLFLCISMYTESLNTKHTISEQHFIKQWLLFCKHRHKWILNQ